MVELVDTQDLKSCSRKRSAGSIPALSTKPLCILQGGFAIFGDAAACYKSKIVCSLFSLKS